MICLQHSYQNQVSRNQQQYHLCHINHTYYFEEDDGNGIIDHALPKNDREELWLHRWADECEGGYRVGCGDGGTVLDDEADVHVLVFLVLSDGDDPFELVDEVGKSKDDSKGDDGAKEAKEEDILEVLLEVIFFEIISSSKDHRRQQSIKEDLLTKVDILNISKKIDNQSKQQSNNDPNTSLVNEVYLQIVKERYFTMLQVFSNEDVQDDED